MPQQAAFNEPATTSSSVVKAQAAPVAAYEPDPWAEFSDELPAGVTPSFPEIKLIQKAVESIPNSGKHGGEFYATDEEAFYPTLDGTFLLVTGTRVMFDPQEMGTVLCASDDGRTPRPGMALWQMDEVETRDGRKLAVTPEPNNCANCQFSIAMSGERSPCAFGFLALFEREDGVLYRIRFKGTGTREMSRFRGALAGMGAKRGSARIGRPIFSKRVHLYTEEKHGESFTWFIPKIEVAGDTPIELAAEYAAFAKGLRDQFNREIDHEADEPVAPRDDGGWVDA